MRTVERELINNCGGAEMLEWIVAYVTHNASASAAPFLFP